MLDTDLLIAALKDKGHTVESAFPVPGNAGDYEFIVDGIETTLPLYRTLVRNTDMQNGDYDIHWLEHFLEHHADEIGMDYD